MNLASCCCYAGEDFQIGISNVTLKARTNSVMVNITIKEDSILELEEERFMIIILSQSLQSTLVVGSPDEAIVTIIDNDRKLSWLNY